MATKEFPYLEKQDGSPFCKLVSEGCTPVTSIDTDGKIESEISGCADCVVNRQHLANARVVTALLNH